MASDAFRPIDPGVDIGHVHLKVADLERALGFYCGVLGFELTMRYGHSAAFISATMVGVASRSMTSPNATIPLGPKSRRNSSRAAWRSDADRNETERR